MAKQENDDILYSLFQDKTSGKLHLYEGEKTTNGCTAINDSICSQAKRSNAEKKWGFICKNEDQARIECAEIGRAVCGNCVKNL